MNTPTPLTDAAAGPLSDCVHGDFARDLERSLTESRALSVELVKQLLEVTGQRDSLRDALKDIRDRALDTTISLHPDDAAKGCVDDVLEYAEQALKSLKP